MDEQEQKETKKVAMAKEDKEDKNPRRIIRFILIIVLSLILLLNLVFAIIYFVKNHQKKSEQTTSDSSYIVGEEIPTIYNHMLSYINIERDDLSLDDAKNIISMQYKDKEMHLVYRCEDHPSYMKISLPSADNVDSALNLFKDNVPALGTYTVIVNNEAYGENKSIVVDGKNVTATVTKSTTTSYVSFIAFYDDKTLMSLTHEEYIENGNYPSVTKVTPESDKLLFDFYYYNLQIEK